MLAGLAALAGTLSAPIRADMLGNAFLSALTASNEPPGSKSLGHTDCPIAMVLVGWV
ncbi:hypothetical protein MAHJHV59_47570 [Mycobacterium avium subsp. hominissuis]